MHFEKIHKLFSQHSADVQRCIICLPIFTIIYRKLDQFSSYFQIEKKWMTLSCSYVESVLSGD